MKWHKLIAMLVVAALVGGFIGVPVARAATYSIGTSPVRVRITMNGNMADVYLWSVYPASLYGGNATTGTFSIDGVASNQIGMDWANATTMRARGVWNSAAFIGDGSEHDYSFNMTTSWETNTYHWSWVGTCDVTAGNYEGTPNAVTFIPLSVSIAGPASVDKAVGGTWTASGAGGTGPYTYLWDYRSTEAYLNYGAGASAGSSFHRVLAAGRWFVGVQVTDSLGATATASIAVSSGSAVGAYSLHFTRYGDYGRFIDVTAWDATGQAVEITGSSATQAGLSGTDGAFGWWSSDNAVSIQGSWAWRYTVSLTVGGAVSPPPVLFWLKGDITVTGGVVLHFQHEFLSITEEYSTILDAGGDPVLPETPPVPESVEPTWLAWLIAKFKEMLTALFVPKMEDINKLLPTSYLVSEWCPIGPNTFANMTSDETFVLPVFGDLRFNLDEVPSGIWTACRVLAQVSISWSLIWIMLGVIG